MFQNPFTPIFGGKPDFFFGREEILSRFDTALIDRGSDYRALFITGTRGYGKTALLEQLSQRATRSGWKVLDIGSDSPVESTVFQLAGASETTKTTSPSVGVSVLGTGASVAGLSSSRTTQYSRESLGSLVLDACKNEKSGLMLTIDEIQKVGLDDVSAICDAFQMASRKGYNAILAAAGLPYSHERIIQHEGCTYLRRGVHESLAPLAPNEVRSAFEFALKPLDGLDLSEEGLEGLVQVSKGHPYITQLLGYYLVDDANSGRLDVKDELAQEKLEQVIERAKEAYFQRALAPMVSALSAAEQAYLRGMSQVIGENRIARTADIAQALGKSQKQTSRARQSLIDEGILVMPRHGELMFGVPYMDDYMLGDSSSSWKYELIKIWDY